VNNRQSLCPLILEAGRKISFSISKNISLRISERESGGESVVGDIGKQKNVEDSAGQHK
jgi:hypothetical protein